MKLTTVNGTQLCLEPCINGTANATKDDETGLNPFLYIIIVMLFYATAMVVLVVKYLRGEKEEASLRKMYRDFIVRDHFVESHRVSERLKTVMKYRQALSIHSNSNVDGNNATARIDETSEGAVLPKLESLPQSLPQKMPSPNLTTGTNLQVPSSATGEIDVRSRSNSSAPTEKVYDFKVT